MEFILSKIKVNCYFKIKVKRLLQQKAFKLIIIYFKRYELKTLQLWQYFAQIIIEILNFIYILIHKNLSYIIRTDTF
jgi:hypothetical protein